MDDTQRFIDAIFTADRDARSRYHVTLGELIDRLGEVEQNVIVVAIINDSCFSVGRADSYRGYYEDLAFEPREIEHIVTARVLLNRCRLAVGATHQGYKGGDYVMGENTPLWIAGYGDCTGLAVIDTRYEADEHELHLLTKQVD